ncbi:hypothetical protein WUBG_04347, partial [Wuchereria bancrofti]
VSEVIRSQGLLHAVSDLRTYMCLCLSACPLLRPSEVDSQQLHWPHSLLNPSPYTNKIDITTVISQRRCSFVPEGASSNCKLHFKLEYLRTSSAAAAAAAAATGPSLEFGPFIGSRK